MTNFYCNKCGLCCQKVGNNPLFSHLAKSDGVCKYYDVNSRLCTIYDNRPIVCNVNQFYEQNYLNLGISKNQFYELNYAVCKKWQEEE